MSGLTCALIVGVAILGLVWVPFCFAYPLWMLIHCAVNANPASRRKISWLVTILFIPLGSLVYGLWGSGKKAVRLVSGVHAVIATGFLIALAYGYHFLETDLLPQTIATLESRLSQPGENHVTASESGAIVDSLTVLRGEISGGPLKMGRAVKAGELVVMLVKFSEDRQISPSESETYFDLFEKRKRLPLSQFLRRSQAFTKSL